MKEIKPINASSTTSVGGINQIVQNTNTDGILIKVYITTSCDIRIEEKSYLYFKDNFEEYDGIVIYDLKSGTELTDDLIKKVGTLLANIKVNGRIILASHTLKRGALEIMANTLYDHRKIKKPVNVASDNEYSDTSSAFGDMMYSYVMNNIISDNGITRALDYLLTGVPVLVQWAYRTNELCQQSSCSDSLIVVTSETESSYTNKK